MSFINEELVQTRFERKGLLGSVLETGTGARAKHRGMALEPTPSNWQLTECLWP